MPSPPAQDWFDSPCRAGTCPHRCRNYQMRTSLFMPAVCRCADGGDMSPPYRGCVVYHGAFSPVDCEERSDTAISCRNYRLRTTLFAPTVCRCADGTPRSSCPTNFDRTLAVGRDDSARRCRNHQMRTNSFVCTVCRFAVFGDISPPYIGCFVYQCMFSPVDCEERSDVAISALSKTTHSPKCVD